MEIIRPKVELLNPRQSYDIEKMLELVEAAGRTCYKSEDKITPESASKFTSMLLKRGHHSVLEHISVTFRIICDRGVTHEIVRHRLASYSQESTRYVNYKKRGGVQFIDPTAAFPAMTEGAGVIWRDAMQKAEEAYNALLAAGCPPEMARSVLPNSTKTEIVATMNIRAWRHFCDLRTAKAAHPQMREVANQILETLHNLFPNLFLDLIVARDAQFAPAQGETATNSCQAGV